MPINWNQIKAATGADKPEIIKEGKYLALKLGFSVPLYHDNPSKEERIDLHAHLVYAKSSAPEKGPADILKNSLSPKKLFENILSDIIKGPTSYGLLVYLCGGPGDGNPPFKNSKLNDYFIEKNRPVLYVDYRGTGKSTPATADELERWTEDSDRAKYLKQFRQDAIVADLEAIRRRLNEVKFTLLCQSYGGWIATTYLSFCHRGLAGVYMTGALPPIGKKPEEVYKALYKRLADENKNYYQGYGEDKAKVLAVFKWLAGENQGRGVLLSDKQRLTARKFLTLGRYLGKGEDGYESVHDLLKIIPENEARTGFISEATQKAFIERFEKMDAEGGFKLPQRPLYGLLHEAIYCLGPNVKSNWAAQRVGREIAHFGWLADNFDASSLRPDKSDSTPLYFSGEMIYDFMLEDAGPKLEPFIEAAKLLAESDKWPKLYDEEQLRNNKVPVRALVYTHDMFVDSDFSVETAKMIKGCSWEIRNWLHGSIKTDTEEVLKLLFASKKD